MRARKVEFIDLGFGCSDEFVYPPMGAQHEKDSFNYQSKYFNVSEKPVMVDRAISRLEELYAPSQWTLPEDFLTDEHILRICRFVALDYADKNPGSYFLRKQMTNNGDVFKKVGEGAILEIVKDRLEELRKANSTEAEQLSTPFRLFQKFEPTKKSKVADKRWRLIFGGCLIDMIIDRLLYQNMIDTTIQNYENLPCKVGMNFKNGGVDKLVRKYLSGGSKNWISFDCKAFDMTVAGWEHDAILELNGRLNKTQGQHREMWDILTRNRERAATFGSIAFSDGTVLTKTKQGIQPSGRLDTIDKNGKVIALLRCMYDIMQSQPTGKLSLITMGDDSVQDNIGDVDHFVSQMLQWGHHFTIESERGDFASQNFCSMKFLKLANSKYGGVPLNWEKNIFSLQHPDGKKIESMGAGLLSYMLEYVHDSDKFSKLTTSMLDWDRINGSHFYRSRAHLLSIAMGYESTGKEGNYDKYMREMRRCVSQWVPLTGSTFYRGQAHLLGLEGGGLGA